MKLLCYHFLTDGDRSRLIKLRNTDDLFNTFHTPQDLVKGDDLSTRKHELFGYLYLYELQRNVLSLEFLEELRIFLNLEKIDFLLTDDLYSFLHQSVLIKDLFIFLGEFHKTELLLFQDCSYPGGWLTELINSDVKEISPAEAKEVANGVRVFLSYCATQSKINFVRLPLCIKEHLEVDWSAWQIQEKELP